MKDTQNNINVFKITLCKKKQDTKFYIICDNICTEKRGLSLSNNYNLV